MKIIICDKTEKEYIEQMRAAGLTVDVRDDITPEELPNVLPGWGERSAGHSPTTSWPLAASASCPTRTADR